MIPCNLRMLFQSTPGLVTRRNSIDMVPPDTDKVFQSTPGLVTRRNAVAYLFINLVDSFNPLLV